MHLISKDGNISLADAENFKEFHIESHDAEQVDPGPFILLDADNEHAWVSIEWLRSQAPSHVAKWNADFNAMIEKVRPFGWISPDGLRVRGHVRRV